MLVEDKAHDISFGDDIDPDPTNCVDCGIALEPGTPPICEECVES